MWAWNYHVICTHYVEIGYVMLSQGKIKHHVSIDHEYDLVHQLCVGEKEKTRKHIN